MSDETEELIGRCLSYPNETWQAKSIEDMTNEERRLALADVQEAMRKSRENYLSTDGTDDDRRCGYEAMLRARLRVRQLENYEASRYDVV